MSGRAGALLAALAVAAVTYGVGAWLIGRAPEADIVGLPAPAPGPSEHRGPDLVSAVPRPSSPSVPAGPPAAEPTESAPSPEPINIGDLTAAAMKAFRAGRNEEGLTHLRRAYTASQSIGGQPQAELRAALLSAEMTHGQPDVALKALSDLLSDAGQWSWVNQDRSQPVWIRALLGETVRVVPRVESVEDEGPLRGSGFAQHYAWYSTSVLGRSEVKAVRLHDELLSQLGTRILPGLSEPAAGARARALVEFLEFDRSVHQQRLRDRAQAAAAAQALAAPFASSDDATLRSLAEWLRRAWPDDPVRIQDRS